VRKAQIRAVTAEHAAMVPRAVFVQGFQQRRPAPPLTHDERSLLEDLHAHACKLVAKRKDKASKL